MAHINPPIPVTGQQAWAPTADNVLQTLIDKVNEHDDSIQGGGLGSGGIGIVDNGDGTGTIVPGNGSGNGSGNVAVVDNNNGTITLQVTQNLTTSAWLLYTKQGTDAAIAAALGNNPNPGGPSVTDNGNGTFTLTDTSSALSDNANGTFSIVYTSSVLADHADGTFTLTA